MLSELSLLCGTLGLPVVAANQAPFQEGGGTKCRGLQEDLAKTVEALLEQRTAAKAAKDWAKADAIRDELSAMHVVVKDTKDGVVWHVE